MFNPLGRQHINERGVAIHNVPMNDDRPHICKGGTCWCEPLVGENGMVFIHNALDKREWYEKGILKKH